MGVFIDKVIDEIKRELKLSTFLVQEIENEGTDKATINPIWNKDIYKTQTDLIEKVIEQNTQLFEQYLEDIPLSFDVLNKELKRNLSKQQIIPVLLGSAKLNVGVLELLDAIVDLLPNPEQSSDKLQGIVFKTKHIKGEGKWGAVRLFSGEIKARSLVLNASKNLSEKVRLIKNIDLQNQEIIASFGAGEIAWVQGFQEAEPEDYLGNLSDDLMRFSEFRETNSFLSVQLTPEKEAEINKLVDALHILNNEDPDLQFSFLKEERELHINIRGEIQKEIIQSVLKNRFDLEVRFAKPSVIYKETPTITAKGYVRYWMPKPCWAIMTFKIEPGPRGSGVQYSSIISVNDVKKQYQNDVQKAIPTALLQGILGWEVDDIIITLISGEDHEVHSKSNDFTIATPMGIMEGLKLAKMSLLEPILKFKITAPESYLGKITSELVKVRSELNSPEIYEDIVHITGTFPVATTLDLPIKLSALTSGKAKLQTQFHGYKTCPTHLGKTREFKGISPLDRAKYILKARKALG